MSLSLLSEEPATRSRHMMPIVVVVVAASVVVAVVVFVRQLISTDGSSSHRHAYIGPPYFQHCKKIY